jgi:hypothetical protein
MSVKYKGPATFGVGRFSGRLCFAIADRASADYKLGVQDARNKKSIICKYTINQKVLETKKRVRGHSPWQV